MSLIVAAVILVFCSFASTMPTTTDDSGLTYAFNWTELEGAPPAIFNFIGDIFKGDEACSPIQTDAIYNCSDMIEAELEDLPPQTRMITNLTNTLFSSFSSSYDFGGPNDDGFGLGGPEGFSDESYNFTHIMETFQKYPNETREMMEATCRGMNKFVGCADEHVGNTECNPIAYRVPKVVAEILCDEEFQNAVFANTECIEDISKDAEVEECLAKLNETASNEIMEAMLGEDGSFAEAICSITATALECVRPATETCGREIFEQATRMGYKVISAVFNFDCSPANSMANAEGGAENSASKSEEGEGEVSNTMESENDESAEGAAGNVNLEFNGMSKVSSQSEEKMAKILDANQQSVEDPLAVDPLKKDGEDLRTN